jgi:hypothetical protein
MPKEVYASKVVQLAPLRSLLGVKSVLDCTKAKKVATSTHFETSEKELTILRDKAMKEY